MGRWTRRWLAGVAAGLMGCVGVAPTSASAVSPSMARAWSLTVSSSPSGIVATQNGAVFSFGAVVRSVALSNGHTIWSVHHAAGSDVPHLSAPGVIDGMVVVPFDLPGRGGEYTHDPSTGAFTTIGPSLHRVYETPVERGGLVAALTSDYGVNFEASTLEFAHRSWLVLANQDGGPVTLPAIGGDRAFAVATWSQTERLVEGFDPAKPCVHPAPSGTGCKPTWASPIGRSTVVSPPTSSDGRRVAVTNNNWLYVFIGATGASGWTWGENNVITGAPTSAGGRVFIGANDSKLRVFNEMGCGSQSCKPLWTASTPGAVIAAPVVANGHVFVATNTGHVAEFNAAGCGKAVCAPIALGQIANPYTVSSVTQPIVAGGFLLVAFDKQLVAFKVA